jgi:hypothetical protein
VTRHNSCRVSPFGHPRINARLTAPRGISQPPTSFIGSQCQGIHHAPLNTYNTKNHYREKLHHNKPHTPGPPITGDRETMRLDARNHYPQIKHHTPPPSGATHRLKLTEPLSPAPMHSFRFPHRDEERAGLLPQSPIVCLMIQPRKTGSTFVVHQNRRPLQTRPIQRIAQSPVTPHHAGRPGSRGAP